jgi:hypothetical protein
MHLDHDRRLFRYGISLYTRITTDDQGMLIRRNHGETMLLIIFFYIFPVFFPILSVPFIPTLSYFEMKGGCLNICHQFYDGSFSAMDGIFPRQFVISLRHVSCAVRWLLKHARDEQRNRAGSRMRIRLVSPQKRNCTRVVLMYAEGAQSGCLGRLCQTFCFCVLLDLFTK